MEITRHCHALYQNYIIYGVSCGISVTAETFVPVFNQYECLMVHILWGLSMHVAMVSVDGSSLPADSQPKSVDLVWGLAAVQRSTAFIK